METEKNRIESMSNSFNRELEEKTGSGILKILEESKKEGKKALEKAVKIGKTSLVTAGILGMTVLGTATDPEKANAYSKDMGLILDKEKIQEIRNFQTSFPADELETEHINGKVETGVSREKSAINGQYGVQNSRSYEISVKGNTEGFPYFHIKRETGEMENIKEGSRFEEYSKNSEIAAGLMVDENGMDKLYGFIKTVENGNGQELVEKSSIAGTGMELLRFLDKGIIMGETEIGRTIDGQETDYGVKIDISYYLDGNMVGTGIDRSIENQVNKDENSYYLEISREFETENFDIYPEIELGDRYNNYSIRLAKGLFTRFEAEAGLREYHQDSETGLYLRAGINF